MLLRTLLVYALISLLPLNFFAQCGKLSAVEFDTKIEDIKRSHAPEAQIAYLTPLTDFLDCPELPPMQKAKFWHYLGRANKLSYDEDTEKISLLYQAILYTQKAYTIRKKIVAEKKSPELYLDFANSCYNLALYNKLSFNPLQAIVLYQEAIDMYLESPEPEEITDCYNEIIQILIEIGDYANAAEYAQNALLKRLSPKNKAKILQNYSLVLYEQKKYQASIDTLKKIIPVLVQNFRKRIFMKNITSLMR